MAVEVEGQGRSKARRGGSMRAQLGRKGGQTAFARTLANTRRALGAAGVAQTMKTFGVRAVKGRGGKTTYAGKNG